MDYEEQFVNSLIGQGSTFRGDIEIQGYFRIDGDFSGTITTESKVFVGSNGRADCTISARLIVIGGIFRGTIYAKEKIVILPSAIVIGNFYSPRLVVEEGSFIHGSFVISGVKKQEDISVEEYSSTQTAGLVKTAPKKLIKKKGIFKRADTRQNPIVQES